MVKELRKKKLDFFRINFDKKEEVENEQNQMQIVSYLKSIRVCRTDYSIKGNKVVQITERKHQDHNLLNILSRMHDGQIFEYVVRKGDELPDEEIKESKDDMEQQISESINEVKKSSDSKDIFKDNSKDNSKDISPDGIELMSIKNQSEIKNELDVQIIKEHDTGQNRDLRATFDQRKQAVKRKLFESSNEVRTRGHREADIDFTANKAQDEEQFIFSIFKQKIKYDGEDAFVIYFKDVTFGVLYEQIKAQKSF